MANLFGAIDVGSHEVELKIFELSKKSGIRQIDDVSHLIDLGSATPNSAFWITSPLPPRERVSAR